MSVRNVLFGAVLLLGFVSAAAARTVTFDFAATNSLGWASSLSYSKAGVELTVGARDTTGRLAAVQSWTGSGLGVKSVTDCRVGGVCRGDEGQIDATGRQDVVTFTFSEAVRITGLSFSLADTLDTFDLYEGGKKQFQAAVSPFAALVSGTATGFGIGAGRSSQSICTYPRVRLGGPACQSVWTFSAFKLTGVTVETAAVPLPAAGVALLAGLGALAGLRRRRRAV